MADLINLRRARKARERAERAAAAAENRVKHGRSKAERTAAVAERERAGRAHGGHRLADEAAPQAAEASPLPNRDARRTDGGDGTADIGAAGTADSAGHYREDGSA